MNYSNLKGFTLVEVMIVIVIVGILVAFALPEYTKYSMRSARSDGQQLAMEVMAAQERYFLERAAYTEDLTQLGYNSATPGSEAGHYSVVSEPCGGGGGINTCVRVTLQPVTEIANKVERLMQADGVADVAIFLESNGTRSDAWDHPINRDPD